MYVFRMRNAASKFLQKIGTVYSRYRNKQLKKICNFFFDSYTNILDISRYVMDIN